MGCNSSKVSAETAIATKTSAMESQQKDQKNQARSGNSQLDTQIEGYSPDGKSATNPNNQTQTEKFRQFTREMSVFNLDNDFTIKSHSKDEFGVKDHKQYNQPTILFYFDFEKREFLWYEPSLNKWDYNDLTQSYSSDKDMPTLKFQNKATPPKDLKLALAQMSCVALTNNLIYLVGGHHPMYNCIEYNIQKNFFTGKDKMRFVRNLPSLCSISQYIYAVSGDKMTDYSTAVERFDTKNNTWNIIRNLPEPQYQGTCQVSCFIEQSKKQIETLKMTDALKTTDREGESEKQGVSQNEIAKIEKTNESMNELVMRDPISGFQMMLTVVGGYSKKDSKKLSNSISVYDFFTLEWQTFDLKKMGLSRIPTLANTPFVQKSDLEIVVLGSNESQQIFKINLDDRSIKPEGGRLLYKDIAGMLYGSQQATYSNDIVYLLCRNTQKLGKVQRGYIAIGDWDLI